ncbi:MAG: hypothetical protein VR73_02680 [Gammaproteobacteria bacterium BRH_c0]|nr:MAG: hypothetical protein VR73_02680 [Gammaproteobacteria bacterium BRH_c0]
MSNAQNPSRFTAPLQVVLMLVIVIATIVAGFVMMPSNKEEEASLLGRLGTTNHGTLLIPVRDIAQLQLLDESGNPWRWDEHKAKWRMLIPSGSRCEQECQELLYVTRQTHLLLGKNTGRFERIYLNLDATIDPQTSEYFEKEQPYLKILNTDSAGFGRWLADSNLSWQEGTMVAVLVDPAGQAMMFYTPGQPGTHLLEDLSHLLRYSAD